MKGDPAGGGMVEGTFDGMFDCIVVGAGPAGGTAAYHLAQRGRSVLVLEREALPRYRICSGGVSPAVGKWFEFDFSPVISRKVNQIRYTWKTGDPVDADLTTPEPMWMVKRDLFDQYLIDQAQRIGAKLSDRTPVIGIEFRETHWQVKTLDGELQARYLIAADGAMGPMAAWLGFPAKTLRKGAVLELADPNVVPRAQFDFGLVKNGFLWSLPKADGYAIGAGTFRGKDDTDLPTALLDYLRLMGLNSATATIHTAPMGLWTGDLPLHTHQALLAGEAAGIADPFTAEGIRPAMFTGIKAAAAIDAALAGDVTALATYSQTIQEEWGKDMAWAQKLAGLFFRVPLLGYKVGVKRPTATDRLSKIMCGEMKYADVATRALKRLSGGLIPGLG
ncbi:MAG: geranylgeranyl reductase family protein [Synechococcales bacterium]|nr:geranylgeranyl reductase family protein [Synechococcales bacterium]